MNNLAAFMTGLNKIEVCPIDMPVPKENEVLIKLEYVGVCGSDVHYLESGKIGNFVVEGDFILGHECAGSVVEIGAGVKTLKAGDRVVLEPGITCGKCAFCKGGKYNLCPDVEFMATPPYHGCLENFIAWPEDMAFKLPPNIDTKTGSLIEPLAVGIHAAKQGEVSLGSNVVILGAGCIGLVTLLACKALGAGSITIVDVIQKRLDIAKQMGATHTINAKNVNIQDELEKLTNGEGFDVVMEAAGTVQTVSQAPHLVKAGGTIVLIGMLPDDAVEFNVVEIIIKEAQIKSVFRYRNIYPQAIDMVSSGMIDVSKIVSHEFDFADVDEAFKFIIDNKDEVVKAVIHVS